ncbi:MAG: hypothetical protein HEQ20_20640 [Aphanizomenon flos-aquae KM1D3_PB]|uniref:hypothetical protein n=1 Tax=Aphanizomenon flos-aquae TaxID=1176 RepID=UPI00136417A5|nr:hypothetical protein [Aphanizomenon flos-aquae]QSV72712.1 MAG: hypothetical protein HEQ20_20640 [Aphanizomenon flos-aquae KM1D3_PB]
MSLWQGKRQEARVKRVWAILRFFTQFGFIVFTYLSNLDSPCAVRKRCLRINDQFNPSKECELNKVQK